MMSDKGQSVRFVQLLETHINTKLQKEFKNEQLTIELLKKVRDQLRVSLSEIFCKHEKYRLSENAVNWLANQYFASIKVGIDADKKDIHVYDLVVINDYNLSELPYHDVELLNNLYSTTVAPWVTSLKEEYEKRTRS